MPSDLQKAPRNFWIFLFAGIAELLVGMLMTVFVGLSHSWAFALLIGLGFFVSANLMFLFAYRKLH